MFMVETTLHSRRVSPRSIMLLQYAALNIFLD